jgi:hypothetical protein
VARERLAGIAAQGAEIFVSDIFTEVDEEVRREQLKKLWDQYGNYLVALAILIVAAVGGWRGYQYWEAKKAAEAGAAYNAASKLATEGKRDEAQAEFARLATEGTAGYRELARLREAAVVAEKDPKAAIADYDAIARDFAGQPLVGDLAAARAGLLMVDTAKLDEMTARLEPMTKADRPFRHTARELLAMSAWRNGDTAAARRWSEAAKEDPEAPAALRSRMDLLIALLPESGKT